MGKLAVMKLRWVDGEKKPIKFAIEELPEKTARKFVKQHEGTDTPKYIWPDDATKYGIRIEEVGKGATPAAQAPVPEPAPAPAPDANDDADSDDNGPAPGLEVKKRRGKN